MQCRVARRGGIEQERGARLIARARIHSLDRVVAGWASDCRRKAAVAAAVERQRVRSEQTSRRATDLDAARGSEAMHREGHLATHDGMGYAG